VGNFPEQFKHFTFTTPLESAVVKLAPFTFLSVKKLSRHAKPIRLNHSGYELSTTNIDDYRTIISCLRNAADCDHSGPYDFQQI
jgi:hypothetical protein